MPFQLVSIIIPVYNGSNFLAEAIESALRQTYPSIEVIVVNDGSTDGGATAAIAHQYADRIHYVEKPNGGVASALNLGILLARGAFVSWLSHDDLYVSDKIARQVARFNELGDPRSVLYSDYLNIDAEGNALYPVRMDHALLCEKPLYAVFRGALHGCSLLIPRTAFKEVGLFRDLPTTQDYDMWFRMIRRFHFHHMPDVLVHSRLHPEQGSRQLDASSEANALWIRMMDDLTPDEIAMLEASPRDFYIGVADFLVNTPYALAHAHALRRAEETSTLVPARVKRKFLYRILDATGLLRPVNRLRDALAGARARRTSLVDETPTGGAVDPSDAQAEPDTDASQSLATQCDEASADSTPTEHATAHASSAEDAREPGVEQAHPDHQGTIAYLEAELTASRSLATRARREARLMAGVTEILVRTVQDPRG